MPNLHSGREFNFPRCSLSGSSVLEPRFNRRLPPEQQSAGPAIMLRKVPQVPESVDSAPRLAFPTLQERVLLEELIDAHPRIDVPHLGALRRVRHRHDILSFSDLEADNRPSLKPSSSAVRT